MVYRIEIVTSAQKQYLKFSQEVQFRVKPYLLSLAQSPRPHGSLKLRGSEYYRIRIGDYRVIYSINDKEKMIRILDMAHRKDVYR